MEKKTVNKKHRKYDENFKSEVLKMTKTRSVAFGYWNIDTNQIALE